MARPVVYLALVVLVGLVVPARLHSAMTAAAKEMAGAATTFLADLSAEQRAKAAFKFEEDSRFEFRYTPRPRTGLPLKEMGQAQRTKALALVKTGLSLRGFTTASTIIDLENVLRAIEGSPRRDPELYYLSVYGTPGTSPWGWKFEGHHVSVNFTIVDDKPVAFAPTFFGANPAVVRDGPKQGTRALRDEEDAGRALLLSFNGDQRTKVIFDVKAPGEMITAEGREAKMLPSAGIAYRDMSPAQRQLLDRILDVYLGRVATELSTSRRAALQKAGMDAITFGWAGVADVGGPHYYRVQGPTFLIEYDNTQNDSNHIHSVWRDFGGDFGRDLLREHYKSVPHE